MEYKLDVSREDAGHPAYFTLSPLFVYGDGSDRYHSVGFYGLREDVDPEKIWPSLASVLEENNLEYPWDGVVPTSLAWQSAAEIRYDIERDGKPLTEKVVADFTGLYYGKWTRYALEKLGTAAPQKPLLRYCHIGWDGQQRPWWD